MTITNPLRIGADIRDILLSSNLIAEHVDGRVYPYTTKTDVPTPHIVYDGLSIDYELTKDGPYPSLISLSINVNTSDYLEGITIAEEVIGTLSEHEGIVPLTASCEYDGGAMIYIHQLTFNIEL